MSSLPAARSPVRGSGADRTDSLAATGPSISERINVARERPSSSACWATSAKAKSPPCAASGITESRQGGSPPGSGRSTLCAHRSSNLVPATPTCATGSNGPGTTHRIRPRRPRSPCRANPPLPVGRPSSTQFIRSRPAHRSVTRARTCSTSGCSPERTTARPITPGHPLSSSISSA